MDGVSVALDGFVDLAPIGRGGIGDVHRATRASTGSTVAIKVLRDLSDRDLAWQRVQRELRALVDLRGHANVVHVEEIVDDGRLLAIVMEYAPGGSVADLMRRRGGPLDLDEVVLVATHATSALVAAHGLGIIHRDIKPHNLLIGAFGQVKVCDFGVAALTRSDDVVDRTDSLSYRFASPEELRGDDDIGPAADVYSLAATLHRILTGQHLPIPDASVTTLPLHAWVAPDDVADDVVTDLRAIVLQCAARDAADRPAATDLLAQLEDLGARLGPERCRSLPVSVDDPGDTAEVGSITGDDSEPPWPPADAPAADATLAPSPAAGVSSKRPPAQRPPAEHVDLGNLLNRRSPESEPEPEPESEPDASSDESAAATASAATVDASPSVTLRLRDGQAVDLDTPITIGRAPATDAVHGATPRPLVVQDDTVSRHHATVRVVDRAVVVTDHGSTNGTTLAVPGADPIRCAPHEAVTVPVGATITVGTVRVATVDDTPC